MTATAVSEIEPPTGTDPKKQQRQMLGLFALFAAVVAPVTVLCLMEWGVMASTAVATMQEWEVYRFALPILAATAMLAMFGALTFLLRRTWPAVGAVVASLLVVVGYFAPMMQMGYSPWGFVGFTLILLALVLVGGLWSVNNAVNVLSPRDLRNKLQLPEMLQPRTIHKVGTLRYTAFGLGMVFFWLLWGDFAFTLFDNNMPNILNLKLKDMGASDTVNIFLNKTISYMIVFLFAPAVSFRSDRHRGRWGRRMPFLFWSTPFVGLFIVLIGWYEPITKLLTGGAANVHFLGMELSQTAVSLIVFGILFVLYDFSNIFVGTVYWYLFNDVVPDRLLSQFMSCFRIVGTLAGMFYSKFIFANTLDHFQVVFTVGGIAYVLAFCAMCVMIKEGNYPPPPPLQNKPTGQAERFFRRSVTQYYRQPGWAFLAACIVPALVLLAANGMSRQALDANQSPGYWLGHVLPIIVLAAVFSGAGIAAWLNSTPARNLVAAICGVVLTGFYFVSTLLRHEPISGWSAVVFALPAVVAILLPIGWLMRRGRGGTAETETSGLPQSRIGQAVGGVPGSFGRFFDNFVSQAETYAKECFTHRFYWYFFLQSMFFFVSWQTGIFSSIRNRDALHLTLQQLGDLAAISGFVSLLLQYPAGWLADKWNPIRVFTFTTAVTFGQNLIQCIFIFSDFTPKTNLLIMYWLSFTLMPFVVLHGAAEIPMYMRLLPKERYGQFCSANAMIRSFALIFGSLLAGYFMDSLEHHFHMGDHRYTYYPVWAVAFQIPAFFFLWLLYREWMRRGGDKGYTPPDASTPDDPDSGAAVAAPAPRH